MPRTKKQPPVILYCYNCKKQFTRLAGEYRKCIKRYGSDRVFCSNNCSYLYRCSHPEIQEKIYKSLRDANPKKTY